MITLQEARKKYCIKIGCGYCLTHTMPLPCDLMTNILLKENGYDWCKQNIDEWKLNNYKKMTDEEINKIFDIKKTKENKLYNFSLLDLIEERGKENESL